MMSKYLACTGLPQHVRQVPIIIAFANITPYGDARCGTCGNTGQAVLDNETLVRGGSKPLGGKKKHIRRWFAVLYIVKGNHMRAEMFDKPGVAQFAFKRFSLAVRGDSLGTDDAIKQNFYAISGLQQALVLRPG